MYSKSEMCGKKNKGGRQRKINEQMETKPAGKESKKKTEGKED